MNETDVRETIVRPLLARLGYAHGTRANIRTEVPLRYDRAFIGRKKSQKDPKLEGRADYICEAVEFGRWIVEVKAPRATLTQDDVEQAHTYSAHPEISASHFLLTNGRKFQLYVTSQLDEPLLEWQFADTDNHFPALWNVLSYDAVVQRAGRLRYDMSRPLGPGLASQVDVISGEVTLGNFISSTPHFNPNAIEGLVASVTGGVLFRRDDGRLTLDVNYRSPMQQLSPVIQALGLDRYIFVSAEEYVSREIERPTIFQNLTQGEMLAGQPVLMMPGTTPVRMPFGMRYVMYSNAVGYFDGKAVRGTLEMTYHYEIIHTSASRLNPHTANLPDHIAAEGEATFLLNLRV